MKNLTSARIVHTCSWQSKNVLLMDGVLLVIFGMKVV